jgi:predicted nucleotidyltransferase
MTPLDRAVHDITQVLESVHIEYAIIGGIANAVWGEPRATIDVDVTVSVDEEDLAKRIATIGARFRPAVSDPVAFVQQTRVLPLDTRDGVRIDVIFALLPFELDAIRRASRVSIAGRMVHVVTAEDLVLMKIISERPRDLADAEAIVRRRAKELDRGYLEPRVRELATALERESILDRWREWTSA